MATWQATSADPNSPGLLEARQGEIAAARQANLVSNRVSYLSELAQGKDVWDVGVVEHFLEAHENAE